MVLIFVLYSLPPLIFGYLYICTYITNAVCGPQTVVCNFSCPSPTPLHSFHSLTSTDGSSLNSYFRRFPTPGTPRVERSMNFCMKIDAIRFSTTRKAIRSLRSISSAHPVPPRRSASTHIATDAFTGAFSADRIIYNSNPRFLCSATATMDAKTSNPLLTVRTFCPQGTTQVSAQPSGSQLTPQTTPQTKTGLPLPSLQRSDPRRRRSGNQIPFGRSAS